MRGLRADGNMEERIISNIAEFREIENEALLPGLSKDELIGFLNRRADSNTAIMADNNKLMREYLEPRLNDIENLGDEDAESLFRLAQKLFTLTRNLDMGLAFEIHACLLKRAKAQSSIEHTVRQLYWMGLIKMQMDSALFRKESTEYFVEAAAYRDRYFEIEDKETRMYINRCLGNAYVAVEGLRQIDINGTMPVFFAYVDLAVNFWNDEKVRALDPDFPWASFIMNAHQNICAWNDVQLNHGTRDLPLAKRVYNSYLAMCEGEPIIDGQFWTENRTEYLRLTSSYHAGALTFDEMIGGLKRLFYSVEINDYSENATYSILQVAGAILTYYEQLPDISKERLADERKEILGRVLAYCRGVPSGVNKQRLNKRFGQFLHPFIRLVDFEDYLDLMLRFTSFSNLSTYVHSVQVKNIAAILTDYFIRENPSLFTGICGIDDETVAAAKRAELLRLVELAALCHDIGKVSYANTIALYSRKLYDFEFIMIQQHPAVGYEIKPVNETMSCVRDVILGHHKWHNGKTGYPAGFDNTQSKYRFIIDIISAADSIDAATDIIGRSYSRSLTLEHVAAEIQEQAGTRYSPIIAEALNNGPLFAEIKDCITAGRENSYYIAYLDIAG